MERKRFLKYIYILSIKLKDFNRKIKKSNLATSRSKFNFLREEKYFETSPSKS